jgi:endonuclease YncB( thermonuclease family)
VTDGKTWTVTSILRIIDGDTFDAETTREFDDGFGDRILSIKRRRYRLARINAAKSSSSAGNKSKIYVAQMLIGSPTITVLNAYKYGNDGTKDMPLDGEWVAEVTLKDGSNLSDLMVSAGHAVYWNGEGPRPNDD